MPMDESLKNALARSVKPIEMLSTHQEGQERINNFIVASKLRPDDVLPT
jgi:hypothetical protein